MDTFSIESDYAVWKPLLTRLDVKTPQIDSIIKRYPKVKDADKAQLDAWWQNVLTPLYRAITDVYNMDHITPEIWDGYKLMGIKGLEEQVMLSDAIFAFKTELRNFYTKTVKGMKNEKKSNKEANRSDSEPSEVQPQ